MIGSKMKAFAEKQGISQRQLADVLQEHTTQVNKVFNGERIPNMDFVQKFIDYFPEVDCNWLLRDEASDVQMLNEPTEAYGDVESQLNLIERAVHRLRNEFVTNLSQE